jgi:hypothetical protein
MKMFARRPGFFTAILPNNCSAYSHINDGVLRYIFLVSNKATSFRIAGGGGESAGQKRTELVFVKFDRDRVITTYFHFSKRAFQAVDGRTDSENGRKRMAPA